MNNYQFFMKTNVDKFIGQWIAICDLKIVSHGKDVKKVFKEAKSKSERDRMAEVKDKTGIKLEGVTAVNPINDQEIPVFVADYVMASYGAGAIMAVPAHDERDNAFAKKHNIDISSVVADLNINLAFVDMQGSQVLACGAEIAKRARKRSEERRVGKECRSRWSPYH